MENIFAKKIHFFATLVGFLQGEVSYSPGGVAFLLLILTPRAFSTPNRQYLIFFSGHINVPSRPTSRAKTALCKNSTRPKLGPHCPPRLATSLPSCQPGLQLCPLAETSPAKQGTHEITWSLFRQVWSPRLFCQVGSLLRQN